MDAFKAYDVFELVRRPPGIKVHKAKIINVKKINELGEVKYKTRCVLQGWSMKKGIDYQETFAPTIRHESCRVLFALSVQQDLKIHHLDFANAYLNGKMKEDVYMEIPEICDYNDEATKLGYQMGRDDLVVKLKKAIYGTPQAGRYWNIELSQAIRRLGFQQFGKDTCIYVYKANGEVYYLGLYVDDIILCGKENETMRRLKAALSKIFKMTDLGRIKQ